MRILLTIILFLAFSFQCLAAPGGRTIGTNIAIPLAYTGDIVFVDRMRHSTSWTTPAETVLFDSNGYPLEVATEGQQMSKILYQNMGGIYQPGNYTISWQGTGSIWVRSPATCSDLPDNQCVITGTDVTRTVSIPAGSGDIIQLKIMASSAADPITELHFITPGFESIYQAQPIHPEYIAGLAEFDFIRVMDFLYTNHSDGIVNWSDRKTPAYHTNTKGVPWEDIFYLANTANKNLWINIPHEASDEYVTALVTLINSSLNSNIHLYIEYSNEIWNSIFAQYTYARDSGRAIWGAGTDAATAVSWWNARRSAQIWQIFSDNLTGGRTFTRVISGQGVTSSRAASSLSALADPIKNPTSQRADAVAIAYYFGVGILDNWLTQNATIPRANVTEADVADLNNHIDELLDLGEATIYGAREQGIKDHAALAAQYNIRLIGYEGGQSYYVGTGYNELAKAATKPVCSAISNHPRMRDLYNKFLNVWFDNNGREFANFSYINAPQSSGAWGIYDYSGDTEGLYKLMGLRDNMGQWPKRRAMLSGGSNAILNGPGKAVLQAAE